MFAIAKRVFLFGLLNILIMVTLSVFVRLTGLDVYLEGLGIPQGGMLAFCLVWGMGGAFISLLLSKKFAKMFMHVQTIDPHTTDNNLRLLVSLTHELARKAKLPKMPEVGIYEGAEVNAFATGPSRSNSLVAVSTGLLKRMNKDEVEGVLAHEVAHIANGDMVTMTLVQGIINAFVMFFARIVAQLVASDDNKGFSFITYYVVLIGCEIAFTLLAMPVVSGVSRWREYRADLGSARTAGKDKMIAALRALQGTEQLVDRSQPVFSNLKISGRRGGSFIMNLIMTHPRIEDRIRRLERARI